MHFEAVQALISLQKGDGLEQRDKVPFKVEVLQDFDAGPDRFIDTAAAMAVLDLVVTIDTSVAHLAGAMNVPTIILLKRLGADWRWLFNREDTVWYPSVRLFRQQEPQNWPELLARTAQEVRNNVRQRAEQR